jgi:hypothetical protein
MEGSALSRCLIVDAWVKMHSSRTRGDGGARKAEHIHDHQYVAAICRLPRPSMAPVQPAHASRILASSHVFVRKGLKDPNRADLVARRLIAIRRRRFLVHAPFYFFNV